MNKTKIEWCDSTWNPVTGCLHECEYCYARRIATRFGTIKEIIDSAAEEGIELSDAYFRNPEYFTVLEAPIRDENGKIEPYPTNFYPTFHRYRLDEIRNKTAPQNIFVCSMADLFGAWVPDEWIEEVFAACEKAPQHRYLFLTKNPARYHELAQAKKLPKKDNFWYGFTTTTPNAPFWWSDYHNTFASIEPILEAFPAAGKCLVKKVGWVILGAMTGSGSKKHQPRKEWIEPLVEDAQDLAVPVFMKDSLIPIIGEENMVREFPWERQAAKAGR